MALLMSGPAFAVGRVGLCRRRCLALALVLLLAAGPVLAGPDFEGYWSSQGLEVDWVSSDRFVVRQTPTREPVDVFVMLHGGGTGPYGAARMTDLHAGGEALGHRVVYAAALPDGAPRDTAWNVMPGWCCRSDDVNDRAYLRRVLATVPDWYPAYRSIHLVGFSNGAMLAETTRHPALTTITSVAGAAPELREGTNDPPMLFLHGARDRRVPLEGTDLLPPREQTMPSSAILEVYPDVRHEWPPGATERILSFARQHVTP